MQVPLNNTEISNMNDHTNNEPDVLNSYLVTMEGEKRKKKRVIMAVAGVALILIVFIMVMAIKRKPYNKPDVPPGPKPWALGDALQTKNSEAQIEGLSFKNSPPGSSILSHN